MGLFHFIPKEADHFFFGVISYSFLDELYYFLVDINLIFIRFPFLRRPFGKKHLNFIVDIVRVIKRTIRDMEVMMKILMALKPGWLVLVFTTSNKALNHLPNPRSSWYLFIPVAVFWVRAACLHWLTHFLNLVLILVTIIVN